MLTSRPATALALALVFALPMVISGCITVTNETVPGASPGASAPPGSDVAAGSPTLAPLASALPTATPQPTLPPVASEVLGFLPNWLIEDAALAIDTDLLTLLAFHGVEASGDGRLVAEKPSGDVPAGWQALDSDAFAALKTRAQMAGVKVLLTIQRFGWTEGGLDRTQTLLDSGKDRRALAGRIANEISERGFDGANLDFEPIPDGRADEYVAFVKEVRTALDEVDPALHLSVDVLPGLKGYDLAGLTAEDAADLAVIMGYNYRTENAKVAGSTAPLTDAETGDLTSTVQEALAQAPGDRLLLALPWFAGAWSTASDQAGAETLRGDDVDGGSSPSYAEAVTQAILTGRQYDPAQASAWSAWPSRQCATCPPVWRQVWYDDPDSFGAKVDLALDQGLAGVGVWALGQEAGREELWWTLRDRLRPSVDATPPNGSAAIDPETIRGEIEDLDVVEGVASLRLFAQDTGEGSGIVLTRVGLDAATDAEGQLVTGRSYPASERIDFPLGDPETGGSSEPGPRTIHVQWRDLAGNWSAPLVLDAWVVDPISSESPEDL